MASKGTIGAKIVLEGEAQYKKALNDIKTAQSQLRSEMKLCNTEFKTSQNSVEALEKKHQILSKQVEQSANKVKVYEQALANSKSKQTEAASAVEKARKEYTSAAEAMEKMATAGDSTNEELEEQQKVVSKLKDQLSVAEKNYDKATQETQKYQTSLNYANSELGEMTDALTKNDKQMDEAKNSANGMATSIDEYGNEVKDASEQTSVFGDVLKANLTSQAIISAIKGLATAMSGIASAAIETGSQFEASMSKVQALSGASGKELEALSTKAKEMGASTMYSASEAADALSYMALAGWDNKSMLEGLEPILSLAASANMDLATASDIVTDSLTAFGLSASDAKKFSDQMAYAMANSNTDVTQLGEAYKNCAAAAGSMNYSVEDVTSALMTMANAGVKGSEAGTALRGIMINLATDTNGCADRLKEFGVEVYDTATGKMNSLSSILIDTASAFDGLSDAEANSLAKTIAGKTQFTGFETILLGLNDAAKASGMSFQDYAKSLEECDGYAKQMADTMQNNLKGKLTILESSLQGLQTSLYETFSDDLKDGVDSATNAVTRLNYAVSKGDLHTSLARISSSVNKVIDSMADWIDDTLPSVIDGLANILDNSDKIIPAIEGMAAAFLAFKGATTIMQTVQAVQSLATALQSATTMQAALNSVSLANPYILLATAFVGVGVAVTQWGNAQREAASELSDTARKSKDVISQTDILNSSIKDSISSRKEEITTLTNSASVAHSLANKLAELQSAYANGANNMGQMKAVVDELNAAVPNLNLSINEQTGELNQSTSAIESNIDALTRQAKAEATREHLTEIAKNQVDAEIQLKTVTEQIADQVESTRQAYAAYNEDLQTHVDMNGNLVEVENEYSLQLDNEKTKLAELQDKRTEILGTMDTLSQEYQTATDYIEENTTASTDNANAMDGLAGSANDVADAMNNVKLSGEELETFQKNVNSAIDSATTAFSEWKETEKVSTETLQANLDSQIEGLNQWANDFKELSQKGVNEGLLQTLAEMGPEAEGYIQTLLSMADDGTLSEFSTKWGEAMTLKEETKASIVESFQTAATESVTAYNEEFANASKDTSEMENAAETQADAFVDTLEDKKTDVRKKGKELADEVGKGVTEDSTLKDDVKKAGKDADENLKQGIEEEKDKPKKAAETMAKGVVDGVKTNLDKDAMYSAGYDAMKQLAQGITDGTTLVQTAATNASNAAKVTTTSNTTNNSNSSKSNNSNSSNSNSSNLRNNASRVTINALQSDMKELTQTNKELVALGTNNLNSTSTISDASIVKLANQIVDGIKNIDTTVSIGEREFGRIIRKAVTHG